MKARDVCYDCLRRLVCQAAELATDDEGARARAIEAGHRVISRDFSTDVVTIVIAGRMHAAVKEATGNPDPYLQVKIDEIAFARELGPEPASRYDGFQERLTVAARGNTVDFFRPLEDVRQDLARPLHFHVDQSAEFRKKLAGAKEVLYLADNAGEVFFDVPLLHWLRQHARVTYVIKAAPVQNDVTWEDVERAGLKDEVGLYMTTGTATPGVDFDLASDEFKQAFERADLVLAKGMGYWESLSELAPRGRVLHCLMAKCQPVADSLGVPLHSYLALLR